MTQNIVNLSLDEAKKQLGKTVSIFLLALVSATVYAEDYSKRVGSKLEKISVSGNHAHGEFVTFSYADSKDKKMVSNNDGALSLALRPNFLALEITPVDFRAWNEEDDRLVCIPSANKKCALTVVGNKQAISLPDACGNYSLLEAWDRYDMLLDGLEIDNPALVEEFNNAEVCFLTMREVCGTTSSSICNM